VLSRSIHKRRRRWTAVFVIVIDAGAPSLQCPLDRESVPTVTKRRDHGVTL
jgi:hypothetical protein